MAYVPTVRVLADPTKHARLYHVLEPLLPERPSELAKETYRRKRVRKTLETTRKWAERKPIISGLEIYKTYHALLLRQAGRLKGKKMIFTNGFSVDLTPQNSGFNPNRSGIDYAAECSRLSESILRVAKYLADRYGWNDFDNTHFVYVAPVICPFHIDENLRVVHSLEDVVAETDRQMTLLGKRARFGSTTKNPAGEEFRQGIYKFSDCLYDASRANEIYGRRIAGLVEAFKEDSKSLRRADKALLHRLFAKENGPTLDRVDSEDIKHALEHDCYFNRKLTAKAYRTFIDAAGLEEVILFASRSSYAYDIIKMACNFGKRTPFDIWSEKKGVMKNATMSLLGECDIKALKKLAGKLYFLWKQKNPCHKTNSRTAITSYIPRETGFAGRAKPKICRQLPFYRCGLRDRCDVSKPEKCAYDFSQNNFTKDDVRAMLGAKLCTSPENIAQAEIDREFEELRFKNLRVKGYSEPVSELRLLEDDCFQQGYSFAFVETDKKILGSDRDEFINICTEPGIYNVRSWRRFKGDKELFALLRIDRGVYSVQKCVLPDQKPGEYSARASEFANECPIARIISKIDRARLPEELLPNKYSVIGIARHKLANRRPWVDYAREDNKDGDGTPVWQYCEKEVFCDIPNPQRRPGEPSMIRVAGHADALFLLTNGEPSEDLLLITDYKRGKKGAYEKRAYLLQARLYAKGVEQALGTQHKGTVINLIKRFFHGEPGEDNFPEYYLGYAPKGSESEIAMAEVNADSWKIASITGLKNIVSNSHRMQMRLLNDKKALALFAQLAPALGLCYDPDMPRDFRQCFNKDCCDLLQKLAAKGEDIRKYLMEGVVL